MQLTQETRNKIDAWLKKYPEDKKQSAVLPALHIVQDEHDGWLSRECLDAVAEYLGMPAIAVYEVATFYNMFELKPVGKHKIHVCNSISCYLNGSEELIEHLEKRLGIKDGETTKDGRFTLKEVECLAACTGAPACQINKKYYEGMTPEAIDKVLEGLE
ncbi:MAG: NADH-quinone oxidoreductase subunit NuoE [Gammaproteobacteria bacterium]